MSNNTGVDLDVFLELRKHLSIVHHIPGRIRLKVNTTILKAFDNVDSGLIDKVLGEIEGIQDVNVNVLARSVRIQYSIKQLQPSWWDTLVNAEEQDALKLFKSLLKNQLASAVKVAKKS